MIERMEENGYIKNEEEEEEKKKKIGVKKRKDKNYIFD